MENEAGEALTADGLAQYLGPKANKVRIAAAPTQCLPPGLPVVSRWSWRQL